ncbi:MAG: acyl-CoA dehydrogenase [Xanthomonadales bacterium]|nr:acyl-CoA dehydrogenase [Xanthomonadales bacterium]
MNFDLNEDQQALVDAARDFSGKALAPHAAEWDERCHFPVDVIQQAAELGFLGLYTPEAAGGLGLSRLDSVLIVEELAQGCTSTTAYMTIHNMCTWMLGQFGDASIHERFVHKMVSGEYLASYCLTEPGNGSDAANLKATARRAGDHYVVNGSKCFISGAGSTQVLVLMARTGADGPKGISCFAVPADLDGISYGKKESKMGWNSQPTRTISFDNCRVPADCLVGDEGAGFKFAMKGLDGGRLNVATCSIGTAQAALNASVDYVKGRKQFGQAIADFQATQFKLADMQTNLVAARQMIRLAASKLDSEHPEATAYCAMAKRFATDACFDICNDALQLHGGYGYIREYPLERMVRDTRVHQILEGTNEIMRVILGRRLMLEHALEMLR